MALQIVTLPARADNYFFLVRDDAAGRTALVDAPEAEPVLAALAERGWGLDEIWLTHHHGDHVEGVEAVRAETGAAVIGAAADAHRLPKLDRALAPGPAEMLGHAAQVIDVPGHTVGHVAFWLPAANAAFTGDSLMALGCGRLFEGTPAQMWASLSALNALPDDTVIYSGHEYTAANARFALTIEPDNSDLISREHRIAAARAEGRATVPSPLAEERLTNPFLRAGLPQVKAAIGLVGATDAESFAEIRRRKDVF